MARGPVKRVAIDIGSSAIKLCELTQADNGFVLTKYAKTDLRVDPSLPAEERAEIRVEGVREALSAVRNKYKKSIFAVPGQSVFVRNRELPSVPASRVADIVRYEITQQIPFPLRDIALDYQILRRSETGEYDVMMVAIKVDAIDSYADVVQNAKLKIGTVDVGPVAAYNWMNFSGEFGEESATVACIDFGASTTDIFIVKDGYFRFTRSLTLAGNHLTEAIKNAFGIRFLEAERMKLERAAAGPPAEGETSPAVQDEIGQRVRVAIEPVLGRLVDELHRSLAFFRSLPEGGPATKIIVTGGGAALRGLVPFLQERLRVNAIEIFNPLKSVQLGKGVERAADDALALGVPLGLALRNHISPAIEINLIPPRIIEAEKRKEQAVYWGLSFATMLLIAASVVPLKYQEYERNVKEASILSGQLAMYTARDEEKNALEHELSQLHNKIEAINQLPAQRGSWLQALKTLRESLPPGVWLASVRCTFLTDAGVAAATMSGGYDYGFYDEEEDEDWGGGPAFTGGTGAVNIAPMQFSGGPGGYDMSRVQAQLPEVNGLTIVGYAPDTDTIELVHENIQKEFKNKGWLQELVFNPQQIQEVDRASLQSIGSSGFGGGGYYDEEEDEGDYYMGSMSYRGRGMWLDPRRYPMAERDTVWQFTMHIRMW